MKNNVSKSTAGGDTWWRRNKQRVMVLGGVAATIAAGCLLYANRDAALELVKKAAGSLGAWGGASETAGMVADVVAVCAIPVASVGVTRGPLNGGNPFPVSGHVRNLPAGRSCSAANRALAAANGITLADCQSYIPAYMKNVD